MPARGVAKQRISAVMRARRSRFQHARRWERGRLARPANRVRKTYPFETPVLPVNGEGVALTLLSLNTGNRDMESGSGASAYASASQSVYGVRKRSFRPTLKRQLQHSEQVSVRLTPLPQGGRGAGGEGLVFASAQSDQPCQPRA